MRELSTNLAQTPKIVYLIGVEGTDSPPHHKPSLNVSHMRKIEQQMIDAINANKN
mgnify:CR=1